MMKLAAIPAAAHIVCIAKLSGELADLKQSHTDRIHVVRIFQKAIKLPTEASKRLLIRLQYPIMCASRSGKLIQQYPILSQIFKEGFILVVLE